MTMEVGRQQATLLCLKIGKRRASPPVSPTPFPNVAPLVRSPHQVSVVWVVGEGNGDVAEVVHVAVERTVRGQNAGLDDVTQDVDASELSEVLALSLGLQPTG